MDNIDSVILESIKSFGLISRFGMLKQYFTAIACSTGIRKRNSLIGSYGSIPVLLSSINSVNMPSHSSSVQDTESPVFRFVYTGQVVDHKGLKQLVAAFRKLMSVHIGDRIELHIIGGFKVGYDRELLGCDGNEKVNSSIVFHGYMPRENVLLALQDMDLGVYPLSSEEAFGYAPLECLLSGIPAVITSGSGFWETLSSDYPLIVSDRDNIDELSYKMELGMINKGAREAALDSFASSHEKYDFESKHIPEIENLLSRASCITEHWNFQEMIQRYRVISDYSLVHPERIFT